MPANIITRKAGYPQIPKCHRILYYLETVFHSLSNFRGKTFETKQIGFLHCRTQSQPNCLFSKKQDALLSKLIIFFFFFCPFLMVRTILVLRRSEFGKQILKVFYFSISTYFRKIIPEMCLTHFTDIFNAP